MVVVVGGDDDDVTGICFRNSRCVVRMICRTMSLAMMIAAHRDGVFGGCGDTTWDVVVIILVVITVYHRCNNCVTNRISRRLNDDD